MSYMKQIYAKVTRYNDYHKSNAPFAKAAYGQGYVDCIAGRERLSLENTELNKYYQYGYSRAEKDTGKKSKKISPMDVK